jgi:putative phage-type endonuclease
MTIETITVSDEQAWLQERVKDITSTEVSALYGLSPYMSEFELYHQKRDKQVVRIEPNERMKWGNRLEAAIAQGAAEEQGWDIEPMKVYMRDVEARIGSSFDFRIKSSSDGPGILEVKNVDGIQYARNWLDDGQGNIEAPEHIELQVQHQMEVADINWCAIVALVGGNTQKVVFRHRDRAIGQDIRQRVADFWGSIEAGRAPSPDYTMDADFIIKQLRGSADPDLVCEAGPDLQDLIKQYAFASKEAKDMETVAKQYKAQILEQIGEASKIITPFCSISCGTTKPSQGTLVTPDMVGTYIGARAGFRNFRLTPKKEK